jgi:hypothetical protein
MPCCARSVELDVQHPLRNDTSIAGTSRDRILNRVFEVEHNARRQSKISFVNEDGSTAQQVPVTLEGQIDRGVQKRVTGEHVRRQWLPLGCDEGLFESDAFIPWEDRLSNSDQPITVPDR